MDTSTFVLLRRAEHFAAYEVAGSGPLVVCVPGMGDLRASYRFLAPALVTAGYRVAIIDLRGHGDSSTEFERYDDDANASDVAALISELGESAVIVGSSMGAAVATIVAATHPELVSGLVLIGPFVRDGKVNPIMKALMRVALAPAFVARAWKSYLPSLYRGAKPLDLADYLASVHEVISAPDRAKAISRTMKSSHSAAQSALRVVDSPVLTVMGELDPDFESPAAEADWIRTKLGGQVLLVPDAGHYPHSQRPDLVVPAIEAFLTTLTPRA